jgi:hypothetical protein
MTKRDLIIQKIKNAGYQGDVGQMMDLYIRQTPRLVSYQVAKSAYQAGVDAHKKETGD